MSLHWFSHAAIGTLLPAGTVDINSSTDPTFNLGYFITPHLAIDVLGGLPFEHDIKLNGSKIGSVDVNSTVRPASAGCATPL